jgi:hypothetical protein
MTWLLWARYLVLAALSGASLLLVWAAVSARE